MTTINPVPWLRSGTGQTPADGGCIMQVIDWIDRNEWTDQPPCVHPVLRRLAITANDTLDDESRQRLLDLAPRMMNTNSDDQVLMVRLAVWCARQVLPIFEAEFPNDDRPAKAIRAALTWCDNPSGATATAAANAAYAADINAVYASAAYADAAATNAANAAYAAAYAANAANAANAAAYTADAANSTKLDLLIGCLDHYEQLTGRAGSDPVDWQPVCDIVAAK